MESMVALGISVLCMAAVMTTFVIIYRGFTGIANYADLNRQSRIALDKMTRDIRQTGALTNGTATKLAFTNIDGNLLQYTYDPAARTLSSSNFSNGEKGILLTNCTSCVFSMFLYDPVPSTTMTFTNTALPSNSKVIVLTWKCCKTNLFSTDTELVETAKIVLRN